MASQKKIVGPLRGGTKEKPEQLAGKVSASKRILVACDGSALNNPVGAGGWCWYVSDKMWAAGAAAKASNNMMELTAVDQFLRNGVNLFDDKKYSVKVLLDSQYVYNIVTKWAVWWMKNGWRLKDGSPVKNAETIASIMSYVMVYPHVSFGWVRAHNGHPLNEAADLHARDAAFSQQRGIPVNTGPGNVMFTAQTRADPGQPSKLISEADSSASLFKVSAFKVSAWPGLLTTEHEKVEAAKTKPVCRVHVDVRPVPQNDTSSIIAWRWRAKTVTQFSSATDQDAAANEGRGVFEGSGKEAILFAFLHFMRNTNLTESDGTLFRIYVPHSLVDVFSPVGLADRSSTESALARELVTEWDMLSSRGNCWTVTAR